MLRISSKKRQVQLFLNFVFFVGLITFSGCRPARDECCRITLVAFEEDSSQKMLFANKKDAEALAILIGFDGAGDPFTIPEEERQKAIDQGVIRLKAFAEGEDSSGDGAELLGYYYYLSSENEKAVFWAEKAVDKGCLLGLVILSHAYDFGNGVKRDKQKVVDYMMLRNCTGDSVGVRNIERMKSDADLGDSLCAEYLEKADRFAADWINADRARFEKLKKQVEKNERENQSL